MEKTLITWTVPNMITIWIMLAVGFMLLALIGQGIQQLGGNSSAPSPSSGSY